MTRKDFELIARVLRNQRNEALALSVIARRVAATDTVDATAQHMATELATTNPAFDRARFLAACGVRP